MANQGVQFFYYTRTLPARSVAIAQVSTPPTSPASLTNINSTPYLPGDLTIRKSSTPDINPADFTAADYNVPVEIHGDLNYRVYNQFFEITNILLDDSTPAFYVHTLPSAVDQQVVIIDLNNNVVATSTSRVGNLLYHSLDGAAYRVRYVDENGYLHTDLLQYAPVLGLGSNVSTTTYTLSGRYLGVASNGSNWIRFLSQNGYQALVPYNTQPNAPWFARIRFSLTPPPPEWANQNFLPTRPYLLGTWIPGTVLDPHLLEFERKKIYFNATQLPDILIFDSNYKIKYALDGSAPGSALKRGTLYNWQRGQIQFMDPYKARIQVAVTLDSTDIVFAFYSYWETDVLYMGLDVNPFTNTAVKDKIIQFYFKSDGSDPIHYIYHQVIDPVSGPISGATNDPAPGTGTNYVFSYLVVGASVAVQTFSMSDIRQRGGGLADSWQTIPQAANFWDLGFWDGKPYPVAGGLAVYVPASILNSIARADVEGLVRSSLAMGDFPVIRYYNPDGSEVV